MGPRSQWHAQGSLPLSSVCKSAEINFFIVWKQKQCIVWQLADENKLIVWWKLGFHWWRIYDDTYSIVSWYNAMIIIYQSLICCLFTPMPKKYFDKEKDSFIFLFAKKHNIIKDAIIFYWKCHVRYFLIVHFILKLWKLLSLMTYLFEDWSKNYRNWNCIEGVI